MVLKSLLLLFFLVVVPVILGLPWMLMLSGEKGSRFLASFPLGYFIELVIFHFLTIPFAFFSWPFTILAIAFSCTVAIFLIVSICKVVKYRPTQWKLPRFASWEFVYFFIFCALLLWQLYNVAVMDTTFWSYDDAAYVTWGADVVRYNQIQTIDAFTGIALTGENITRILQSSLYFPGFLTLITGIPATIMNRTILEVFNVFLAYAVYAYMASVIFKKRENGLIFLILLSVLHIFGYYSQYSISFRLLGPNYQGKAILAASLFPFLFSFMIPELDKEYDWRVGFILLMLSTAASALTLFGTVTFIINLSLTVLLSLFRKSRKWKHLWYLAWGCTMPVLCGGIYFIYKYFRW